jgi:hypothetical protein
VTVALADGAELSVTVRVTSGGTAGPGLASRRPVVVTSGVSLDVAPVVDLAAARSRRTA